jgi:hypothetical protein
MQKTKSLQTNNGHKADQNNIDINLKNKTNLLKSLKKLSADKDDLNCEDLLQEIYESCLENTHLNSREDTEIGNLLSETAKHIFLFLFNFGYHFDPMYGLRLLKYRSALEYMCENFSQFDSKLSKVLNDLKRDSDTLKVLDKAVKHLKSVYIELDIEEEDLFRPKKIPTEHTWWIERK